MLFLQAQPGEERQDLGAGQPPVGLDPGVEGLGGVADFALAGEEDQDVAGRLGGEFVDGVADGVQRIAVLLEFVVGGVVCISPSAGAAGRLGQRPVADLHRERAPGDLDDGGGLVLGAEVLGEALRIDGGRGDDDLQVRPLRQDALEVAQDEVDVEAALVGFVDDDGVVFAQQLVALDLRQQDAVGHELDLGGPADFAREPDLEAHFLADLDAEFLGDALGHGAGGEPARLGVADQAVLAQAQLQAHLGDLGGLTRAGLAGDDGHLVGGDGGHQVLAALGNRQLGGVGDVKGHGWNQSTVGWRLMTAGRSHDRRRVTYRRGPGSDRAGSLCALLGMVLGGLWYACLAQKMRSV